ncbi:hypothetical protein LSH36_2g10045, partial [Paralvinella palmiformis]
QLPGSTTGATYKVVRDTSIRGRDKPFHGVRYSYTEAKHCAMQHLAVHIEIKDSELCCAATVGQAEDNFMCGPRQHEHQPSVGAAIVGAIAGGIQKRIYNNTLSLMYYEPKSTHIDEI